MAAAARKVKNLATTAPPTAREQTIDGTIDSITRKVQDEFEELYNQVQPMLTGKFCVIFHSNFHVLDFPHPISSLSPWQ